MNDLILKNECQRRLAANLQINFLLASYTASSADAWVFAAVEQQTFTRARWRIDHAPLDVIVANDRYILDEIGRGLHSRLVSILSRSHAIDGDKTSAYDFLRRIRALHNRPPTAPTPAERFRFQCEPFDLLRQFYMARDHDAQTAGLCVGRIVQVTIDGFFALNALRRPQFSEMFHAIQSAKPDVSSAIHRFLNAPYRKFDAIRSLLRRWLRWCSVKKATQM